MVRPIQDIPLLPPSPTDPPHILQAFGRMFVALIDLTESDRLRVLGMVPFCRNCGVFTVDVCNCEKDE